MIRHDGASRLLAIALSTLAGYIDATGFLMLGGFFVSFMSGNTTRLGVGLVDNPSRAALAAGLIAVFVLGVMLGSLCGHVARRYRRAIVLALVSLLLFAAASIAEAGLPLSSAFVLALAMGAENVVFEREGEVQIGVTYMTGTLVKLGQHLVGALLGREQRMAWMPYLLLWLGLLAGTVAGAIAHGYWGTGGLWLAAGATTLLALLTTRMETLRA